MSRPFIFIFVLVLLSFFSTGSLLAEPAETSKGDKAKQAKDKKEKPEKKPKGETEPAAEAGDDADTADIPADEKAEKKNLKKLGENFKVKRTQHYSVLYDTSEEDVAVFNAAIERTYRSCTNYTKRLGMTPKPLKRKLIAHFFNEEAHYRSYASKEIGPVPDQAIGLYAHGTNYTYFYNIRNTESFKKSRTEAEQKIAEVGGRMKSGSLSRDERRTLQFELKKARWIVNRTNSFGGGVTEETLQHEVTHQVLYNIQFHNTKNMENGTLNPRWFVEGTAQMFEPISDGKAANFGMLNKTAHDGFRALVERHHLIPLKDFVTDPRYLLRSDAGEVGYPQAWAVVHYLNRARPKDLKKYIDLINSRPKDFEGTPEKELATFEKAFGKLDDKWERRWKAWMSKVH